MGLGALKCDGYADIAKACCAGEDRLAASDFSGKEVLTAVVITGTLAAVSGCISYSSQDNDGGALVTEPKDSGGGSLATVNDNGPVRQPQNESYPFDINANTDSLSPFFGTEDVITRDGRWKGPARFDEVGEVRGIHSELTGATYWIEFRGIGQGGDGARLAHYNVYRVDSSGTVEKQQVDLQSAPLSREPEGIYIEAVYRKNPRLGALLDFQGDDKSWPDMRFTMANYMETEQRAKLIASEVKASDVKRELEEFEKRSSQWKS